MADIEDPCQHLEICDVCSWCGNCDENDESLSQIKLMTPAEELTCPHCGRCMKDNY